MLFLSIVPQTSSGHKFPFWSRPSQGPLAATRFLSLTRRHDFLSLTHALTLSRPNYGTQAASKSPAPASVQESSVISTMLESRHQLGSKGRTQLNPAGCDSTAILRRESRGSFTVVKDHSDSHATYVRAGIGLEADMSTTVTRGGQRPCLNQHPKRLHPHTSTTSRRHTTGAFRHERGSFAPMPTRSVQLENR